MAWITLTEDDIITKLSGPEKAAMNSAALQALQTAPLPEVIEQIVKEIRGYVAACARNTLGDGLTIPDELLGAAVTRVRFELATRLPVPSLLTEDRRRANETAITLLRDVAACSFAIVAPATPTSDEVGAPSPQWSVRDRQFGRSQQDGI